MKIKRISGLKVRFCPSVPPLENKKNAPAILSLAICVFLDWMSDGGAAKAVAFDRSPMYLTP